MSQGYVGVARPFDSTLQASYDRYDVEMKIEDSMQQLGLRLTEEDAKFLYDLVRGKAKRKKREAWFLALDEKEKSPYHNDLWLIAQGALATAYCEDPP